MARSTGVALAVLCVLAACCTTVPGVSAARDLRQSHDRALKLIWNVFTNRGWSAEANFGLGFKYKAYGGKVKFGPLKFKKDEAPDPSKPTLLQELFPNLFG